jgi:GH43 family beta-xylosidase
MRNCYIFLLIFLAACRSGNFSEVVSNPILFRGADPWIITDGDSLRYCYVHKDTLFLKSTRYISGLKEAEERILWVPEEGTDFSKEIWAPELYWLNNRWYIYVAADNGKNENHRMYVLGSEGPSVNSKFKFLGKISDVTDKWAIDGTVFEFKGKNYFIWSGWEGDVNVQQNLYIAEMTDPLTLNSERVLISEPEYVWEKRGSSDNLPTINEGPQILQRNGRVFLTYSASGSWSNHYCLGMLELRGDNPLKAESWVKFPQPVFESNDIVTSPGHASFIRVGKKDYIVYHSARNKGAGWDRVINIQQFGWKKGKPDFGIPVAPGENIKISYK